MTIKEAIVKQMLNANRECPKHNIEYLDNSEFPDEDGMLTTRTGDYVCTECGKIWSQEEYQKYLQDNQSCNS